MSFNLSSLWPVLAGNIVGKVTHFNLAFISVPSPPPPVCRKQFPSTPTIPKIPSWQIPLKPPSAPGSPSVNSSSDISPVSNESDNSSPVKDGYSNNELRGPDGAHGINGDADPVGLGTALPLDLKDQVRMEVQGEEEKREDEEEDVSNQKEEEELSMQTENRRGGDGQINEQVDKLRRPEGASNESEVD